MCPDLRPLSKTSAHRARWWPRGAVDGPAWPPLGAAGGGLRQRAEGRKRRAEASSRSSPRRSAACCGMGFRKPAVRSAEKGSGFARCSITAQGPRKNHLEAAGRGAASVLGPPLKRALGLEFKPPGGPHLAAASRPQTGEAKRVARQY
eukprot:5039236-Alexandrium_andersonii.AAC.1